MTGKELSKQRKARGLSMRELSRRAKVSVATISHWERGLFIPYPATIKKVVVAMSKIEKLPEL